MKRMWIGAALLLACDGASSNSAERPPSPPNVHPSADVSPEPPIADAKPSPEVAAGEAKPAVEPPPTVPEEWLVWFRDDEGWQTRWYQTDAAGTLSLVASTKALVLADDKELWHAKRNDSTVKVRNCVCLDVSDEAPGCAVEGKVRVPGLTGYSMTGELHGLASTGIGGLEYGEFDERSLRVVGGAAGRLFFERRDAGYYCGAHAEMSVEHGIAQLNDESTELRWLKIALPKALRESVADDGLFAEYTACDGDADRDTFLSSEMELESIAVSLADGKPRLSWGYRAPATFMCSSDYFVHASTETGLLPEAEALGLNAPLSHGLAAALADVGTTPVVGWSAITLSGQAHEEALAWFGKLEGKPWPPQWFGQVDVRAKSKTARSKKMLHLGRKLTREGKYEEAIAKLDEAVAADPSLPRPWAARCYTYLRLNDLERSRKDCEVALSKKPTTNLRAAIEFNLGTGAEREGDFAAAKAHYQASLKLRSNNFDVEQALDRVTALAKTSK